MTQETMAQPAAKKQPRTYTYAPGDITPLNDNPQFQKLSEENKSDPVVRKARWASLQEEFIERSITGRQVHWPSLAAKYGFPVQTVRNRASKYRWYDEISKRAKEREDALATKLTERTMLVLEQINEDFATSEEAIRKRHTLFARSMQEKAIEGLRSRDLATFKPHELIRLLELGLIEERKAMGMQETADLPAPPDENEVIRQGYKSVFESIGGHQKVQQIGTILLRELTRTGGRITDVAIKDGSVQSTATKSMEYQPVPEAKPRPKFKVTVGPKAS